jgi:hypothetical protein
VLEKGMKNIRFLIHEYKHAVLRFLEFNVRDKGTELSYSILGPVVEHKPL